MPANLAGYLAFSLLDLPFSSIRVGCKSIRPTKRPKRANTCLLDAPFSAVRVGRKRIRPTKRPEGADSCLLDAPFSAVRVGRKSIRPTKRPEGAILSIYRSPHLSLRDTYRAYSIRPYPTGRRYFYHACHQFFSGIHPFLVLIQEKEAKRKSRHQGCRPIWPGTGMGRQGYRGIWPRTRPSRF